MTHQVTLADGTPVDVSHSGTVAAQYVTVAPDDQVSIDIVLAFPNIAPGGATVEVLGLPDGTVNGFIKVDGSVVATLDAPVNLDVGLPFEFIADCE